jgi:ABC-type lipoprotein release transport system permease subunit
MLILKMAFRNIFRQKRRTVLTALSMFGGFVMATVFIGWADGSYNGIIDNFTRHTFGHIQIHEKTYLDRPSLYKTIGNFPQLEEKLAQVENVDSWAPRIYSAGLASVAEKTSGVRIIGIDPQKEVATTGFDKKLVEGKMFTQSGYEAIIGKGVAKILNARLHDKIDIVSQGADGSIANDRYSIVGIVDSGDEISDRTSLYLPLQQAQELLVLEERIHEVAITVSRLRDIKKAHPSIQAILGDERLVADPWQVFARSFYIAMKADMEGMWISLLIIVLIVAVGVLNTVLMSVLERTREYGVLKAIGTKPGQIIKLVLTEVNIIAVLSVLLGIAVGLIINSILAQKGINLGIELTYGGMKFDTWRSEINARSFYIPAITVFLAATLVGFFPALKAARTDPAKSMRIH